MLIIELNATSQWLWRIHIEVNLLNILKGLLLRQVGMGEEDDGYLSKFQTAHFNWSYPYFVQFLGTFAKVKRIIRRLASGKGSFDNCKQNWSWVIANWWEWTCLLIWTVELYLGTMNFDSKCFDLFWFLMKYSIKG